MTHKESDLAGTFAAELAKAVESTTGERPAVEIGAPVSGVDPGAFAWRQEFSGGQLQAAWIAAEPAGAHELGGKLLRAAGIDEYNEREATSTYLETLRQALSSFSRAIGARDGREIKCLEGSERECPADQPLIPIRLTFTSGTAISVYAQFREEETPPETPPPAAGSETQNLKNLDLLLDVELPVTVSFGRAELPLKDVIKLTTGSTIELNRTVSDPVELIVNNCVIAKGEIVVVDGNFAVRIERVISRQDRLRSLG